MKKIKLLFMIILLMMLVSCAHNIGGNVTGLLISQGGIFFGTGTIAIVKENAKQTNLAGSDSNRIQYEFKTGTQTSGYDVELAKYTHLDTPSSKK